MSFVPIAEGNQWAMPHPAAEKMVELLETCLRLPPGVRVEVSAAARPDIEYTVTVRLSVGDMRYIRTEILQPEYLDRGYVSEVEALVLDLISGYMGGAKP